MSKRRTFPEFHREDLSRYWQLSQPGRNDEYNRKHDELDELRAQLKENREITELILKRLKVDEQKAEKYKDLNDVEDIVTFVTLTLLSTGIMFLILVPRISFLKTGGRKLSCNT